MKLTIATLNDFQQCLNGSNGFRNTWIILSCFIETLHNLYQHQNKIHIVNAKYSRQYRHNSTQQDITDVGADTSYVRIYISNSIKTL